MTPFRSPLAPDANTGAVALVTGGGTGIGRSTALELARTGASVAVCGRRPEPLQAVRRELEALGVACVARQADVREPDQVEALVDHVLEELGPIDVLVNNAGGQFIAPAEEISANGWRAVHRLAVDAAWNLTRLVATRSMIPARRGIVVFVGFSPRRGIPGMAHASAARAALENLAGSLAVEWSRFGIRAVCVAPGTILTEGLSGYGSELVERWTAQVPLGRLGRPEDIKGLAIFLASDASLWISGAIIPMDGGNLAKNPGGSHPGMPGIRSNLT